MPMLGEVTSKGFLHTALWTGVGVALYFTLLNTIGSLLNPLLAALKLSATPV